MLFSGFEDLAAEVMAPSREKRAWAIGTLPLDLYERLNPGTPLYEFAFVKYRLERVGVRRDIANAWPQRIGYNVALKLAERGRIAFGSFCGRRDLKRAARARKFAGNVMPRRVEANELLAALRAAGLRLPKAE